MEHLVPSLRADNSPTSLRVLVIDYDLSWLEILVKMLKKCSNKVSACSLGFEALKLLNSNKDGFDLVISDVNMPDMDGFKLIEAISLETGIPVIMMSDDGDTNIVMKGVQHGASEFILKPISFKELKNLLQHMMRKKICDDSDDLDSIIGIQGFYHCEDKDKAMNSPNKRKEAFECRYGNKEATETPSPKKARVIWSVELHEKFLKAVEQLGSDKVGPKKILDLMNVSGLTRENVASHLQKYRLYMGRQNSKHNPHQNDGVSNSVPTQTDQSVSDNFGYFGSRERSSMLGRNTSFGTYVSEVEDSPTIIDNTSFLDENLWSDKPSASQQGQNHFHRNDHSQGLLPHEVHPLAFEDPTKEMENLLNMNFKCYPVWETEDMLPPPPEIVPEYYWSSHPVELLNDNLPVSLDSDGSDFFSTNSCVQEKQVQDGSFSTEIPAMFSGQDVFFNGMCSEILAALCEEWPFNNGSMDNSVFHTGIPHSNL